MGLFRLLLSIAVLIFHSSTLLGTIGYSAVFGFYIMSVQSSKTIFKCNNKFLDKPFVTHCPDLLGDSSYFGDYNADLRK